MTVSTSLSRSHVIVHLLLCIALVLTAAAYWPSLHGGYVFDDFPNIVDNREVHMTSLDWPSLHAALLSSPSALLVRPLAMLSFALNWLVAGSDSYSMKLVNLGIHLLNGLLLFGLLRAMTRWQAPDKRRRYADLLAATVAGAWLLAPINFTAVAYIVQRMESLCQIFVLGGLWAYVAARVRMRAGGRGLVAASAGIVLGTALGGLAKESAALLPLYAAIVEWVLFGFKGADGKPDRRLYAMFGFVLVIPACAAAFWVWRNALPDAAWANRPFTLMQRLLTEPRIVLDYARWSLLPTPNTLALYHDQIALSRGLLQPFSTAASIACLTATGILAVCARRRWPLACVGVLWFFAAHLITATVIPLELAYEHRNYFASAGLYLAVFSALLPESGAKFALARGAACVTLVTLFACVTWIRALDWSNPLLLAVSESEKNPDSPRTAYELGRMYVLVSGYRADSPLIPEAYAALEHAATMPGADALPDQGLMLLSARLHREIPPAVWARLQEKLRTQPISAQNINGLLALADCAIDGACQLPPGQMVASFGAALDRPRPDSHVLSIYSNYAINVLQDVPLAIELARATVEQTPRDLQARKNLLLLLAASGQHDAAETFYRDTLRDLPQAGDDPAFRDLLQGGATAVPQSSP